MSIDDRSQQCVCLSLFKHGFLMEFNRLFRVYSWFDERNKKMKRSAPQYIELSMMYIQKTLSDETIFPTRLGKFHFFILIAIQCII